MWNDGQILFPVDFSEKCLHTAPFVRSMAASLGARITLLHVVSWPRMWNTAGDCFGAPESAGYTLPIDLDAICADRQRTLSEFASRHFGDSAADQLVQSGDAASAIVECAVQRHAAMIMMPTRGAGRFRRFLLGSVTAKVLHDVDCAVWTDAHTEEPAHDTGKPIRNILCGIELEKRRLEVLKWAAAFAQAVGAELTLTHVVPAPEASGTASDPRFGAFLKDTAKHQIEEVAAEANVTAEICIEGGKVVPAIRRLAEMKNADLVIIGRGCLPNALGRLRTHAYGIIRESPCPVVSV